MISHSRLRLLGLSLVVAACAASADDGVPALLQFAEKYRPQERAAPAPDKDKNASPAARHPAPSAASGRETLSQRPRLAAEKAMREKDQQLARQQAAIQSLQQELTAVRAASALVAAEKPAPQQDLSVLRDVISGVRQAFNITPKEQQALALIAQAQNAAERQKRQIAERDKQLALLKQQVAQLQAQSRAYTQQIAQQQKNLVAAQTENAQSIQQRDELKKSTAKALAAANLAQRQLRDEIGDLRGRARLLPDGLTLKKPAASQDYAAGVALGRDIQTLLAERKSWGVEPDEPTLLAGIVDTFSGRYQLNEALLASSLAASEKAVNAARSKAVKEQETQGDAFVAAFSKKKGIKKSASGFWYRVDYAGDEPIAENAQVDIVVKEMLTDGRVIQDMDRGGKVLSQPLSAYPPLFREAIGYLKKHGSLTMVVPPALAYGEAGFPPQIPPNATMVYELRVADVNEN